jgi:hypothetical protein
MADKNKNEKPKYTEVPKDEIAPTIYKSQFSSDDRNKTITLQGVATPQQRDKKND